MHEVSCTIPSELAEQIQDHLCEYVRSSWCLLQIRDDEPFTLQGFFAERADAEREYEELRAVFSDLPTEPNWREFDDQEWQNAYKEFIDPWSTSDLHWVPVWRREDYDVPAGDTAIYLDAGMAFGTGSHETTRMMAQRLLDYRNAHENFAGKRVIDAGCGSGILAISAAKLGFNNVYAFDRDPEAVRVSLENRAFNELPDEAIAFAEAGIEDGLANRQADLMLANIQADVLKIYAEQLIDGIAPGGVLAMTGILTEEVDQVISVFTPLTDARFANATFDIRVDGEWCDLCMFTE